jgi:uncharacterized membrane protein YagU involved in acid resistance
MDITQFLAQLWGPTILAVGLGILISRRHYTKVYRDIEKEPFAMLTFGMFAVILGIIHVQLHNSWNTVTEGLVSLLGLGLLVKGFAFIIFPGMADAWADYATKLKLIPIAAVLTIAIGVYLSYIGYLA